MYDTDRDSSLLQDTIKWITRGFGCHICLHDMSGILKNNSLLKVHPYNSIHHCCFCSNAKTTPAGLKFCLRCKACTVRKAKKTKEVFIGRCYLGITEIVKPVYIGNSLACIIYLGNLILKEDKEYVGKKLERICKITGVNSNLLLEALTSVSEVTCRDVEEFVEIADFLNREILTLNGKDSGDLKKGLPQLPAKANDQHWVIESIIDYVNNYYNNDIRLSHLANLYSFNLQYLCRLFSKVTGMSFTGYVNKIRIEKSKYLLKETDEKIINISLKTGFDNVTYFNRLFKSHTGLTPGKYRRSWARSNS